jgi:hypothetical protein
MRLLQLREKFGDTLINPDIVKQTLDYFRVFSGTTAFPGQGNQNENNDNYGDKCPTETVQKNTPDASSEL